MAARVEIIWTDKYLTTVISLGPWEWQWQQGIKAERGDESLSYTLLKPDWSPELAINWTSIKLLRRNCHQHAAPQPDYNHIVAFGFGFHSASGKVVKEYYCNIAGLLYYFNKFFNNVSFTVICNIAIINLRVLGFQCTSCYSWSYIRYRAVGHCTAP